jgi:hypothetical protein
MPQHVNTYLHLPFNTQTGRDHAGKAFLDACMYGHTGIMALSRQGGADVNAKTMMASTVHTGVLWMH